MTILQKISRYLLLPLAVVLLLTVAAGYWLLATESGSGWTLRRVAGAMPGLTTGEVSGTLLAGMRVRSLEVSTPGFQLQAGSARGEWDLLSMLGGQFQLKSLHIDNVLITLKGEAEPGPPGQWPSLALPFPTAIGELAVRQTKLQREDGETMELGDLTFSGAVTPLHYRIESLEYRHPRASFTAAGRFLSRFPYDHELRFDWRFQAPERHFAGDGTLSGRLTGTEIRHQLTAPGSLETVGSVALENRREEIRLELGLVRFDTRHQWRGLLLKVADMALVSSGEIDLGGRVDQYNLAGWAELAQAEPDGEAVIELLPAEELPAGTEAVFPARLDLEATGSTTALTIAGVNLRTATGAAVLSGDLEWERGIDWALTADTENLSLAAFLPPWPAVVSGTLRSSGSVREGGYSISAGSDDLRGTIRDVPFNAQLAVSLEPQRVEIGSATITVGENHLEASGSLGRESDLHWELAAPALETLGLDAEGSLHSRGRIAGTLENPRGEGTIDGEALRLGQWSLQQIEARLSADSNRQLQVAASVDQLSGPGLAGADIAIEGSGSLDRHQLVLRISDSELQASLTASGGYREQRWTGTVREASIESRVTGAWQQRGVARAAIGAGATEVRDLCLVQDGGELCLEGAVDAGTVTADVKASDLALSRLEPWLPDATAVGGTVDGAIRFTSDDKGPRGRLSLTTQGMELSYLRAGDERFQQSARAEVSGVLDNRQLSLEGRMAIDEKATLDLTLNADLAGERALNGEARLQIAELQWLEAVTTGLESPAGRLHGEFAIAGTVDAPRITGNLELADLTAGISATGVAVTNGNASLELTAENRWRLDGSLLLGAGEARISGEGELAGLRQQQAELSLTGSDLALVDLPDTRIRISPDIRLILDGDRRHIAGDISIPFADITLNELPGGAVTVSGDEEVHPPLEKTATTAIFTAELNIRLGDSVHIAGYGLEARLAGGMALERDASGAMTARGRIDFRDGMYEAYGQELKISRGHLLFQGSLENPGVNFRAVRSTPTGEVGLRVTGELQDFNSEVFSDPPLPPTDALTLLVTGKPPSDMSQSDANVVVNAAAALGIAQSEWITSRLQSSFGLDMFALEGGDTYEESSLVVGKQLTPRLLVSYVQNLFSPASSFVLEYQLSRQLNLKAESGESQSLDLLYKIEH